MEIIYWLLQLLVIAIIIRSLLSWVDPMGRNPFSRLLIQFTEPVLAPIRNLVGGSMGGFDLSPIIAIVLIQLLTRALSGAF